MRARSLAGFRVLATPERPMIRPKHQFMDARNRFASNGHDCDFAPESSDEPCYVVRVASENGVALLVILVALAASLVPSVRAARVEPIMVLREE